MRLVPCARSEYHGHYPEGEACSSCESTAVPSGLYGKPAGRRLYEHMVARDESVIAFAPWDQLPEVIREEWVAEAAMRIKRASHPGGRGESWMLLGDFL